MPNSQLTDFLSLVAAPANNNSGLTDFLPLIGVILGAFIGA